MTLSDRLVVQVTREPIIERYPPVVDLEFAIEVALEKVEEWDYEADAHGWCHERPILIALIAAAINGRLGAEDETA